jgi:hypothetical protein
MVANLEKSSIAPARKIMERSVLRESENFCGKRFASVSAKVLHWYQNEHYRSQMRIDAEHIDL